MADPHKTKLESNAQDALAALFTHIIRNDCDYDPDHSGPEDVGEAWAELTIKEGLQKLASSDPREFPPGYGE